MSLCVRSGDMRVAGRCWQAQEAEKTQLLEETKAKMQAAQQDVPATASSVCPACGRPL